jgi:AhpD family alkylhydroperoxidase
MIQRLEYAKAFPEAFKAMIGVEQALYAGGVDVKLLHMVKLRVSQINGCAYCVDMHWKDAKAAGETEQRLYGLSAWRESPYYTDTERAALSWAESLTLIPVWHNSGAIAAAEPIYAEVRRHFDDRQLAALTWAVAAINAWNRIAIGFRSNAGAYQPPKPRS